MKVRLSPRALQDLDRIAAHIRLHHRAAAVRVRDEIQASFDLISRYPEAGRAVQRGTRRLVVPRTPYVVIYRLIRSEPTVIVTIRHTKRRPETGII